MRILFTLLITAALATNSAGAARLTLKQVSEILVRAAAADPAPDFSYDDLSFLDLSDLDFKRAKLIGANLYGADLSRDNLSESDLSGADLDHTNAI